MTIDEAIRHCEEVAEQNETKALSIEGTIIDRVAKDCRRCAADHRQLAEWLTELKELREIFSKVDIGAAKPKDYLDLLDEWAKARKLLKAAVEDFTKVPCNNDAYNPNSCGICVKQNNCNYSDSFKWRYTDEALALIGGGENGT